MLPSPKTSDQKWVYEKILDISDPNLQAATKKVISWHSPHYYLVPGSALKLHHYYTYGLITHIREMVDTYQLLKDNLLAQYPHNHNLVISALLIHDLEKCTRFTFKNNKWIKIQGHDHFRWPMQEIRRACAVLKINYQTSVFKHLEAIILSHHGDTAPAKPSSQEARIVAVLDYLSAKLTRESIWGINYSLLPPEVQQNILNKKT